MPFFGGCDGNKLQMGVAAILTLVAILMVWYISNYLKDIKVLGAENMCGGFDQGCKCSGNETMVGGPPGDGDLSKVLVGY